MSRKTVFLTQILDKLGAPLLAAVNAAPVEQNREAERVAELIGRSVQLSMALAGKIDPGGASGNDSENDALRLALTGLAAGLVSGHYRRALKAPDDAEMARLSGALEAVLSFADNFTPAADGTARLAGLEPGFFPADESQIAIQYAHIMTPVINAIATFSYGRPEKKLMQEVAGRLVEKATQLRAGAGLAGTEKDIKQAELGFLRALAQLYVGAHEAEQLRLLSLGPEITAKLAQDHDGLLPMDPVWQDFERRAEMMMLLGQGALPGAAVSGAGPAPKPAKPVAPPPAAPPAATAASAAPAAQEPPPVAQQEGGGAYNPMSFFKPGIKKPGDEEEEGQ